MTTSNNNSSALIDAFIQIVSVALTVSADLLSIDNLDYQQRRRLSSSSSAEELVYTVLVTFSVSGLAGLSASGIEGRLEAKLAETPSAFATGDLRILEFTAVLSSPPGVQPSQSTLLPKETLIVASILGTVGFCLLLCVAIVCYMCLVKRHHQLRRQKLLQEGLGAKHEQMINSITMQKCI